MLAVLSNLFETLEAKGLRYTIWKSLEGYAEQLAGNGDVDVLFADDERTEVHRLMAEIGFPEDFGTNASVGEDVKVYRGFDGETATHTSIHAYFRCRLGSKAYKEYRFPFEEEMFEHSRRSLGAIRAGDGHFIVTRFLMVTLRRTYEDTHVRELAAGYPELPEAERAIIDRHLAFYLGTDAAAVMKTVASTGPACLARYHRHAHDRMNAQYPVQRRIDAARRFNSKETLFSRHVPRLLKFSRNKLSRPISVLLAGHDGTGKTTVSRLLERQLAAVGPSRRIYLGRNAWSGPNRFIDRLRMAPRYRILNRLWPYTSTIEIVARIIKGKMRVALGWIVIYDRSIIDLLCKYEDKRLPGRWFPMLVARVLAPHQADLCYLLRADPDVVIDRKGKHTRTEIHEIAQKYMRIAGEDYRVVDTTHLSAQEVASRVIRDVFEAASRQALGKR